MGSTCSGCMSSEQPANVQNPLESSDIFNMKANIKILGNHKNQNLSSTSAVIEEDKEEKDHKETIDKCLDEPLKKKPRKAYIKKKKLERITEARSGKIIIQLKSLKDVQFLKDSMNKVLILRNLDDSCKQKVIESMKLSLLEPKETIYEQGRLSECFYIVSNGRLEVIVDEARVSILKQGDCFGEQSLIDDCPHICTVRTLEKSMLWFIDRTSYKVALESQSALEFKETLDFMISVPIFKSLTNEQLQALLSVITIQNYDKDQVIFLEGEPGDTLHIVKAGEVNVVINKTVLRVMGKGSFYGDQALINRCLRTATIIANTQVTVLVVKRDSLTEALGTGIEDVIFRNTIKMALEKTTILRDLSNMQQILDIMKIIHYSPGDVVIKKGDRKGQKLYIVVKGKLKCGAATLETYDIIGENEMKKNSKERHLENVVADIQSVVAEVSKKKLENFIDVKIKKLNAVQEILTILQSIDIFRYLTVEKLKLLIKVLSERNYAVGENVITQGETGDKLFIIKEGTVNVVKNNDIIRILTKGNFFGERALVFNETRSANVVATSQVVCWVLEKSSFKKIVDEKMNNALMKRVEIQDDMIGLNDLVPIKVLGKGTHGIVYLCAHKDKKNLYALKSVTRQKVAAYELYENLNTERNILMKVDHLMIVKLVKTFKDNLRIYFLMEFIRGIDLFDLQSKISLVPYNDCRFFTACIVLILEFLHRNDIIYRDLKPENLLVDEEGYIKIIDFGSAKIVKGKTYTSLGTPHYMAPEVMTGTGYTSSVDWWSLGIIMYEMLEGIVPFGPHEEDPISIYEKVMDHNLIFNNISEPEAKSIIQQLLNIKPGIRNSGNTEKLKSHEYFEGLNWEGVICRQHKPKFVPKSVDISQEVSRAFKARKILRDFINREEAQDVLFRQNSKPITNYNWDVNF